MNSGMLPTYQAFGQPAFPISIAETYTRSLPNAYFGVQRLRLQQEILENRLADCVTYLHAFRRKLSITERLLARQPPPQRRQRKQLQHIKRKLEQDIKIRVQEEFAVLSNLHVCNANLLAVDTLSKQLSSLSVTELSSDDPAFSSSRGESIAEGTDPTEHSSIGWTDDAPISPFLKESTNPIASLEDIAPDTVAYGPQTDIRIDADLDNSLLLTRYVEDKDDIPPAPPNTALPSFVNSTLCPKAPAFESHAWQVLSVPNIEISRESCLPEHSRRRRATHAGTDRLFQDISLRPLPARSNASDDTITGITPRRNAVDSRATGAVRKRSRASSL